MMPYPEFTFFEGMLILFKFLMLVVLLALLAAVVTMPLFFAIVTYISKWLGAREGMDRTTGSIFSRTCNFLIWIAVPLLSLSGTVFLLGYSGGLDAFNSTHPQKSVANPRPIKREFVNKFEDLTRNLTGQAELISQANSKQELTPDEELEKIGAENSLKMMRSAIVFFIYQIGPIPLIVILAAVIFGRRKLQLIVRSLNRNPLRTSLMYVAIFVLSSVLALVWTVLSFIDEVTTEQEGTLKAIITERYQIPSQLKPTHVRELWRLVEQLPPENRPQNGDDDLMTWAFLAGTLDPKNKTAQNSFFLFCMEPRKVLTMLDGLEDLTQEQRKMLEKAAAAMEENKKGVVIGLEKLTQLGKRVGDRIQLTGLNYTDLVFDMEIVGTFPGGTRYDQSAVMNRDYLYQALDRYKGEKGKEHPMADKCLNLIWLRLPNKQAFDQLAELVDASGRFSPSIKIETSSSGISTFLDAYKEILWGLRWILAPVLMGTMILIIAVAISISVRERRTEMAVLKVLGYQPGTIMLFVLGEAIFIGMLSGFLAMCLIAVLVNVGMGGVNLKIAFFGRFFVPNAALWWGPALGTFASLVGSIIPALSARSVKVTDVFSRVA